MVTICSCILVGGATRGAGGEIVCLTTPWEGPVGSQAVSSFGDGVFGYSDLMSAGDEAVVVFERDRGLWEDVLSL